MTRWRSLGRGIVVDVSPLRGNRDFQMLFLSRATSSAVRQVVIVAVPLQIFAATGSSLAVGLIGAAQLIPLLLVALLGGALADAVDRRKLLVVGQILIGLTCAGLAWYASSGSLALWPIYALVVANAVIFAIEQPTRTAVLPTVVSSTDLPSALALNQVLAQLSKAAVPAVTGFLVAYAGATAAYVVAALLAVVGVVAVVRIRALPRPGGGARVGLSSVLEGLRYIGHQPLIKGALLIDLNAMVFGMPSALFPEIGTDVLGGNATTVGLLYAAPGFGALLAALTSGWLRDVVRQGRAIVISVVIWGVCIAAFGFAATTWIALVLLTLAGAADVVSAVFRNTVIQTRVSDALRGRVSSVHIATVSGGPRLGDLEAGLVASLTSIRFSVVSGGLACAAGTMLIARWIPQLARYQRSGS